MYGVADVVSVTWMVLVLVGCELRCCGFRFVMAIGLGAAFDVLDWCCWAVAPVSCGLQLPWLLFVSLVLVGLVVVSVVLVSSICVCSCVLMV